MDFRSPPPRRAVLAGAGALLLTSGPALALSPPLPPLGVLEDSVRGRLGVYAMRLNGQPLLAYRQNEPFPMCSTFKVLLVGAVLARIDQGRERLDRLIAYSAADILPHAPVTQAGLAKGALPVATLCAAAIQVSDNTAANLLLASVGGPAALTRYARSLGDTMTRLDRTEPTLNTAIPGDRRDTTSPRAMAQTLRALLFGDALSPAARARLSGWMRTCETGTALIRAGLPAGWRAGDKTGRGEHGSINDIAVLWPPRGEAIIVTAYLTASGAPDAKREQVLAAVGRLASGAV